MRAQGEGNIRQRSDGRWEAALQVNGRRRSVYGRTRADVAAKLRDLQKTSGTPIWTARQATQTLGDFLDQWLDAVKPALRPSTFAYYESLARHHVKPALGRAKLKDLKPLGISLFYADLAKKGLSAHRAFKVHRLLTKALNDAVK